MSGSKLKKVGEVFTASSGAQFFQMQVLEDKKKVLVSHQKSNLTNYIMVLSLTDMSVIGNIGKGFYNTASYWYSARNNLFLIKDLLGTKVKFYEISDDLETLENESNADVAYTFHQYFSWYDFPEMNLLFQGGKGSLCAIDLTSRKTVAKFNVDGDVYSITVSKDKAYLLFVSRASIDDGPSNKYHKISLK